MRPAAALRAGTGHSASCPPRTVALRHTVMRPMCGDSKVFADVSRS